MSWDGIVALCIYIYFLISNARRPIENKEPGDYLDA